MASSNHRFDRDGLGSGGRERDIDDGPLVGIVPEDHLEAAGSPPECDAKSDRDVNLRRDDHSKSATRESIENARAWATKKIICPPDDEVLEKCCPFLWEGLTMTVYADGTARIPWEIKIVMVNGAYAITLTDHDLLKKLPVLAGRAAEIMVCIETVLTSVAPPWIDMDKSYKNRKGLDKFKKKN